MASNLAAARAAQQDGDLDRAVALARQAHRDAPHAPEAAFLLCCLLLNAQNAEASTLLATLEQFPSFAPGWEELGHALTPRHGVAARIAFRRAAKAYATMEQADPRADIAYRLGRCLARLGQTNVAREAMQRATQRDPAASQAWFSLGLLCQDLADCKGAVTAFQAALAARPDFHEAAFNLGVASQESGDMDGAMDAYAVAWRLRPSSFGRIAQALVSPGTGRLWLQPTALRQALSARA